jgi:hypothetical protein
VDFGEEDFVGSFGDVFECFNPMIVLLFVGNGQFYFHVNGLFSAFVGSFCESHFVKAGVIDFLGLFWWVGGFF